jgi:hypothetical protein
VTWWSQAGLDRLSTRALFDKVKLKDCVELRFGKVVDFDI